MNTTWLSWTKIPWTAILTRKTKPITNLFWSTSLVENLDVVSFASCLQKCFVVFFLDSVGLFGSVIFMNFRLSLSHPRLDDSRRRRAQEIRALRGPRTRNVSCLKLREIFKDLLFQINPHTSGRRKWDPRWDTMRLLIASDGTARHKFRGHYEVHTSTSQTYFCFAPYEQFFCNWKLYSFLK